MHKIQKYISLLLLTLAIALTGACSESKTPATSSEIPAAKPEVVAPAAADVYRFNKAALYPEGVEYDAQGKRFLVTSIRQGIIGAVHDDGLYEVVAQDSRMVSAVGIRIDAVRDRFLVCNADPGVSEHSSPETTGKLAGLAVFQLSNGALITYLNLAEGLDGGHFCNDIAVDKDGTAYITDSFSNLIYKVDAAYNVSVFISNDRFSGQGFNLNGIVIKDNYLLVDKFNDGTLFKVPLDKPEAFTQVKINQTFTGADGLLWAPDGSLVLIANDSVHRGAPVPGAPAINDRTIKLSSTDDWQTASVVKMANIGEVGTTTGVLRDGEVYVIYSMLQVLFNPKTEKHIEEFSIVKQDL